MRHLPSIIHALAEGWQVWRHGRQHGISADKNRKRYNCANFNLLLLRRGCNANSGIRGMVNQQKDRMLSRVQFLAAEHLSTYSFFVDPHIAVNAVSQSFMTSVCESICMQNSSSCMESPCNVLANAGPRASKYDRVIVLIWSLCGQPCPASLQ